ncbi:MAG: DUF4111 domain-containing protein [Chloroflexi bacterium]|nr:DUF4111 domain-containing protein [Chloroflexota bacterium]
MADTDAATAVAHEVAEILGAELKGRLAAVYLHGSATLGGFRWDVSDLDVLALTHRPLADGDLRNIPPKLAALRYPRSGLELSIMTVHEATDVELPAPRYQLHHAIGRRHGIGTVVDGRSRDGDPDLVRHLAICRLSSVALAGPPARDLITEIPDGAILEAIRAEVRWAVRQAPLHSLVLTACRAWLYSEDGQFASKQDAGNWAAQRYPHASLIRAAVSRQEGAKGIRINRPAAERLAKHVEEMLAAQSS